MKWKLLNCLTLCDPMVYTAHGFLQARILEWVAFPSSRGSSRPWDRTQVSCIADRFFTSWATRKALLVLTHFPLEKIEDSIPIEGEKGKPTFKKDKRPPFLWLQAWTKRLKLLPSNLFSYELNISSLLFLQIVSSRWSAHVLGYDAGMT